MKNEFGVVSPFTEKIVICLHFSEGKSGHFGLQTIRKSPTAPLLWSDWTMYNATTNYTRLDPMDFEANRDFVVYLDNDKWRGDDGYTKAFAICERSKCLFFSRNVQQVAAFQHPKALKK